MIHYLKLFRLPLVFTAIADSAAGFLFVWAHARGDAPVNGFILHQLGLASAGLYMFGMAMNDVADRERDRTIAPTRALPSGKISLKGALIASFGVLGLSLFGALVMPAPWNPWRLGVWALAVAFILVYDFVLKLPPVMGIVRALNVMLGAVTAWGLTGGSLESTTKLLALPPFIYVTALTYVSTLEEGKIRLGKLALGGAFMVAGAFAPALIRLDLGLPVHGAGWAASALLAAWTGYRAATAKDRKGIMLLVRDGVGGIIVLDAAMLLSAGHVTHGLSVALLVGPAVFLVHLFKKLG